MFMFVQLRRKKINVNPRLTKYFPYDFFSLSSNLKAAKKFAFLRIDDERCLVFFIYYYFFSCWKMDEWMSLRHPMLLKMKADPQPLLSILLPHSSLTAIKYDPFVVCAAKLSIFIFSFFIFSGLGLEREKNINKNKIKQGNVWHGSSSHPVIKSYSWLLNKCKSLKWLPINIDLWCSSEWHRKEALSNMEIDGGQEAANTSAEFFLFMFAQLLFVSSVNFLLFNLSQWIKFSPVCFWHDKRFPGVVQRQLV